jgi:bis(5'-nucleosyl)-tetraphosphatase (symmetrical)
MARYAIGDIQGCHAELRALLRRFSFKPDRDRLWFVGDLVNRGPESLEVLRFVRSLGDNAVTVLGNHDLHLLALAFGEPRAPKPGDTLLPVLEAPDRAQLLDWLLQRPLAWREPDAPELLIHAGLAPQWTATRALELAREVEVALRRDPARAFAKMYGNRPERWDDDLRGSDRLRYVINALTRMRFCASDGTMNLKLKGAPDSVPAPWMPWYDVPGRQSRGTRVVFGHWSTLGLLERADVLALDTGCVWGGGLTACRLDDGAIFEVPCRQSQPIGAPALQD